MQTVCPSFVCLFFMAVLIYSYCLFFYLSVGLFPYLSLIFSLCLYLYSLFALKHIHTLSYDIIQYLPPCFKYECLVFRYGPA